MKATVAGPLVVAAAAAACAQPQAPPGGQPDNAPPRVIEVSPAAFDTLTDLDRPVVIRFDERISEQFEGVRRIEEAVLVSPLTGAVEAERQRRGVEVSLTGGWQPDRVYQVVVLPVLRDLFGNARTEPVELVFSTGAPIPETAVAGFVQDRLTGEALVDGRVHAAQRPDSTTYQAVTDSAGFFSLRYLPPGTYDVRAWRDQNRDREADFAEAQASMEVTVASADTLVLEMGVLPMDTTPARLALAEAVDSTRVRLLFDDYFEPGGVEGSASLYLPPDSTLTARGVLVHGAALDSLRAREAAEADSIRRAQEDSVRLAEGDTIPADTAAVDEDVDTLAVEAERAAAAAAQAPLPSRELLVVFPRPLVPGQEYIIVVEDVTNIRGLPGGGGSARFEALPPPDTVPTYAPPMDTVPSDTVPADTVPADPPTDTVPRDTTPAAS